MDELAADEGDVLAAVGVVVVTHASAATIGACLSGLPLERLADVVVVDHASTDDSVALARAAGVRVVEQANTGFGAGCNRGVAELAPQARLVLLLNPDAVLLPTDLALLVGHLAAEPQCAVVGPRIHTRGGPTYSAGRRASLATELRPLLPAPLSRLGPVRRLPREHAVSGPVGYVEGACLLVRRDVWGQVGGFDEGYFLYFEELDLARRVQAAGWQVHLCAQARVEHAMGVSTATSAYGASPHLVRSRVRYLRRWHGEPAARVWGAAARASWALRVRRGRLPAAEARALAAALREALSHAGT